MMRGVLFVSIILSLVFHPICAIHSHDAARVILQPALNTFIQAVHAHQADTLPACTAAQEQCIANGQSGQPCDAKAGCQSCPLALAGYTCQPTARCLTSTSTTAVIAYPVVPGYKAPTTWAVGGPSNCAVTADCYFNQQACLNMGQNENGDPSQDKCSAFSTRAEYSQQECQFCVSSVTDGVGSLTAKDCTYTPKAGCTDTSQQPAVTRSGTCPGAGKTSVFTPSTPVITTTTTTTTTAPSATTTTKPAATTTTKTTSTQPVRQVAGAGVVLVSMVSMVVTGITVVLLA